MKAIKTHLEAALRGEETATPVVIYWDTQDPSTPGPAYRIGNPSDGTQESGGLEFYGWAHVSGREVTAEEVQGYDLGAYFAADGRHQGCIYLGPDQHGIYPILAE